MSATQPYLYANETHTQTELIVVFQASFRVGVWTRVKLCCLWCD